MWHAQVTSLTLRCYPGDPDASYAAAQPYTVMAQVELLGSGYAYLHAMMTVTGAPFTRRQYMALCRLLQHKHDVTHLIAERHGKRVTYELAKINPPSRDDA